MNKQREELLRFEGVGRNVLEARIAALVKVLDAANELLAADDAANVAKTTTDVAQIEERYEAAWERLRATLKNV